MNTEEYKKRCRKNDEMELERLVCNRGEIVKETKSYSMMTVGLWSIAGALYKTRPILCSFVIFSSIIPFSNTTARLGFIHGYYDTQINQLKRKLREY